MTKLSREQMEAQGYYDGSRRPAEAPGAKQDIADGQAHDDYWDRRASSINMRAQGSHQTGLRVESHGPQVQEEQPPPGKPTWSGLIADQQALADAEEAGEPPTRG